MTTILQSFDRPLPHKEEFVAEKVETDQKSKSSAPDAHVSGASTEISESPTMGFNAPYSSFWAPHAQVVLDDPDVRSSLSEDYLASPDRCTVLTVEADVADASALQLVNPVNLALSAYHEDKILCVNQKTIKKGLTGTVELVRSDKAWRLRDMKDSNVHFAVVDYKRPGVIRPEEFRNGLTRIGNFGKIMPAYQEQPGFLDNSHVLLKQAVNYADMYGTKYIAFFDWDTLVLLYMADAQKKLGGDWCWVTVITNRSVFRRALLAFLERAYQAFKARQKHGGSEGSEGSEGCEGGGGDARDAGGEGEEGEGSEEVKKKDGEGIKMREFPVPKPSPPGEKRVLPARAAAAASSASSASGSRHIV